MKDDRPFCECGNCDSTNRHGGGREVRLPMEAWEVAGAGDLERLAVLPTHARAFDAKSHTFEWRRGWAAVGTKDAVAEKPPCGFCGGGPVGDAASWVDGKPRPPAPCPRCGETAA